MRKFAFRRTAVVGAIWLGLLGVLAALSPYASGQETVEPGKGNAFAQGIKLNPFNGQLSFGVTYGEALARHQNRLSLAEAHSLDLGVIGLTLAGEGCDGGDPTLPEEDQPQPLTARTDNEEDKTKSNSELGVQRDVSVSDDPFALARATTAGGGEPGALTIGSSVSETTSGLVDGRRLARAVTTVSNVDIGGAVKLTGMRWVAEYQTEPEVATITRFSIEGIEIAGTEIPLGEGEQLLEGLEQANAVLEQVGIRITAPRTLVSEGIAFVDPLKISIVPNETRDGVLGGVLDGLQPVREELVKFLVEDVDCSFGSLVTVADVAIGSVTGAGSLHLELGGVTATSGDIDVFGFPEFDLPAPPAAPAPPPVPPAPATSSGFNTTPPPPAPTTAATPTTSADTPVDDDEVAAPVADTRPLSGDRGGPLLYTGLAGLLLLGLLAEGDRRKMRKAQRSTAMTPGA